jgi:hypothetical protein
LSARPIVVCGKTGYLAECGRWWNEFDRIRTKDRLRQKASHIMAASTVVAQKTAAVDPLGPSNQRLAVRGKQSDLTQRAVFQQSDRGRRRGRFLRSVPIVRVFPECWPWGVTCVLKVSELRALFTVGCKFGRLGCESADGSVRPVGVVAERPALFLKRGPRILNPFE